MVSFILQLVFALFFWLCGFLDRVALPTLFRDYRPFRLSLWLTKDHHQVCLWTQLVFCLALCIAGLIRHVQRHELVGAYESASIVTSVPMTVSALILATVSYFPEP